MALGGLRAICGQMPSCLAHPAFSYATSSFQLRNLGVEGLYEVVTELFAGALYFSMSCQHTFPCLWCHLRTQVRASCTREKMPDRENCEKNRANSEGRELQGPLPVTNFRGESLGGKSEPCKSPRWQTCSITSTAFLKFIPQTAFSMASWCWRGGGGGLSSVNSTCKVFIRSLQVPSRGMA